MDRKSHKALVLLLCLLAACMKDKPPGTDSSVPGATGNIYIVCEGNYGNGDASLYAYQPTKDSVYGDLYKMANNTALGDVFQSMQHIGSALFLCINNSNKIVVLDAVTWKQTATIAIPQPRYILPVSTNKAYVSSLYSNKVYVIDPQTALLTDSISLPAQNAEGMCLYNGNAFMASWDTTSRNIFELNTVNNGLLNTYAVTGYAPQELLLDKEQMLWILAGDEPEGRIATLTRIDPSTGNILQSFTFPANADPLKPAFNNTKDTLYFLEDNYDGGTNNNGLYRMNIHDEALPQQPFVQALSFQYFYALGIDPVSGYIYIGDPKGFIQKGSITVLKPDGTVVTTFSVGVGPGHFYFDE